MTDNTASMIHDIIQKYPEDEWLDRCREALPGVDDAVILSAIEIFCGGDTEEVNG
jgi:hypothetical protein